MRGAKGGSRLGHVKSDARRGLRHAAHRQVVALPKRRKPEGRSRSGDRGGLPHAATKGFARSYRINLRLLPELAVSSGHDARFSRVSRGLAQYHRLSASFYIIVHVILSFVQTHSLESIPITTIIMSPYVPWSSNALQASGLKSPSIR